MKSLFTTEFKKAFPTFLLLLAISFTYFSNKAFGKEKTLPPNANIYLSSEAVVPNNILRNSTSQLLYILKVDNIGELNATATHINFSTSGNYTSSDLKGTLPFKVYHGNSNVFTLNDPSTQPIISTGNGEFITIPFITPINIKVGISEYFFITVDIDENAQIGNTIKIDGLLNPVSLNFMPLQPENSGYINYYNSQLDIAGLQTITNNIVAPLTGSITSSNIYCAKSNLELKASATGGTGTPTYSWTGPNGFISAEQNPVIVYAEGNPSPAGTYTVTVSDEAGGTATASVVVVESANPELNLIAELIPDCDLADGFKVTLTASGGTGAYLHYTNSLGSILDNIAFVSNTYDTAILTVKDSENCIAQINYNLPQEAFIAPLYCLVFFDDLSKNAQRCEGTQINLIGRVPEINNGHGGNTYLWTGPNNFSSTSQYETLSNLTPSQSGIYQFKVTDRVGCEATGQVSITVLPAFKFLSGSANLPQNSPNETYITDAPVGTALTYSITPLAAGTITNAGVVDWAENFVGVATIKVQGANACEKGEIQVTVSPTCPTPTFIQNSSSTATSFYPYTEGTIGNSYVFRFRQEGTTDWTEMLPVVAQFGGGIGTTISGLTNNTNYEFQVKQICATGGESEYSISKTANTYCQTFNSYNLNATNVKVNSANIQWANNFGVPLKANIRYRKVGEANWVTIIEASETVVDYLTNHEITGLDENSNYEYQIQAVCLDGSLSPFSESKNFTTPIFNPCPTPTFIQNSSSTATSFYPYTEGTIGNSYVFRFRQEGTTDWTEMLPVVAQFGGGIGTTISGLTNNTNYEFQVKQICATGGESEYSISKTANTYCQTFNSYNLNATNVKVNSANIQWANNFGVPLKANIRYRKVGEANWVTIIEASETVVDYLTNHEITGLDENSNYEYQIQAVCLDGSLSPFSDSKNFTTLANPTESQDPIAMYPLNGDANDTSGNNFHGAVNGGAGFVNGVQGQALHTNVGQSQYVTIPNNTQFENLTKLSLAAWVKPQTFDLNCWNEREMIIGKGQDEVPNGYAISIQRNTNSASCGEAASFDQYKFNFEYGGKSISSPFYNVDNKWRFVTATYDNNILRLYIDGQLVNEQIEGPLNAKNTLPMYFNHATWQGGSSSGGRFGGALDNLRIYNRPITGAEIQDIHNAEKPQGPLFALATLTSNATGIFCAGSTLVLSVTNPDQDNVSYIVKDPAGQVVNDLTIPNANFSGYFSIESFNIATGESIGTNTTLVTMTPQSTITFTGPTTVDQNAPNTAYVPSLAGAIVSLSPAEAGSINQQNYTVDWNENFYGVATISAVFPCAQGSMQVTVNQVTQPIDLNSDMVAYYKFDGGSGADQSGKNNNPSVNSTNPATDRYGVAGNAATFGNGKQLVIPNSPTLQFTDKFTNTVWIKLNTNAGCDGFGQESTNGFHPIFTKSCDGSNVYSGYGFNTTTNKYNYSIGTWTGGNNTDIDYTLGTWAQLASVYDGTTVKQYLNGVLIAEKATSFDFSASNGQDLYIGKMGCFCYYFNGDLDDIRFYKRALSTAEIAQLYQLEAPVAGPLTVTNTTSATLCANSNLELKASATGGTLPYIYSWSGPNGYTSSGQNPVIVYSESTPVLAGTYTVLVTDGAGATTTASVVVVESTAPKPILTLTSNSPVCPGQNIQLMGSSSIMGLEEKYFDKNGNETSSIIATSSWINDSKTGTYKYSVKDIDGCISEINTDVIVHQITVSQHNFNPGGTLILSDSFFGNISLCEGGNLASTAYTYLGNGGYTYEWSGPNSFVSNDINLNLVNVLANQTGKYTLKTTDQLGCITYKGVDIQVNTNTPINFITGATTLTQNAPNETYTTDAPTGTPLTYTLEPTEAGTVTNMGEVDWAENFSGTATIKVTDAANCGLGEKSITITPGPLTVTNTTSPTLCAKSNLELKASVTGGTLPYIYSWSGPNGYTSSEQNPVIVYSESTPVLAGTYTVTVTDGAGNTATASVAVTESTNLPISLTVSPIPDCNYFTQSANLVVTGGAFGMYTFTNTNGSITGSTASFNNSWDVATLTVTDIEGCKASIKYQAPYTGPIQGFGGVNEWYNPNADVCLGNSINLKSFTQNGTQPFQYNWTGPNGFQSSESNPTISNATNLMAGNYTLVVTDAKGCNFTIYQNPTIAIITPLITSINFVSGAGNLLQDSPDELYTTDSPASGVNLAFSISPSNAGTIDNTGKVNWDELFFGTAIITVQATSSCIDITKTKEVIIAPGTLKALATSNLLFCAKTNLELKVTPSGGNPIYTYVWNGPNGFTSTEQNPIITYSETNPSPAGTYTVIITDAAMNTATANIVVSLNTAPQPIISLTSNSPLCPGQNIVLTGTNSIAGLEEKYFDFNNLETTNTIETSNWINIPKSGTYKYTVKDVNGCISEVSTDVIVHQLTMSYHYFSNGTVFLLQDGFFNGYTELCANKPFISNASMYSGNGGYSYQWAGPNNYINTNLNFELQNPNTTQSGLYTLKITDQKGCVTNSGFVLNILPTTPITITGPTTLAQNATNTQYTINQPQDPSLSFTISPTAAGTITNIGEVDWAEDFVGTATIKAFYGSPCGYGELEVLITPGLLVANVSTAGTLCPKNNLELKVTTTGGAGGNIYAWTGPNNYTSAEQNPVLFYLEDTSNLEGTYTVVVTDGAGASATSSVQVIIPTASFVNIAGSNSISQGTFSSFYTPTYPEGKLVHFVLTPSEAGELYAGPGGLSIIWNPAFFGKTTIKATSPTDCVTGEIEITVNQVIPDIIPPTISCPTSPEAIPATAGQNAAIVNFNAPLAEDNSGQVTVIQTEGLASGSVFPLGETINTFIATDASGNSTSCSFTISIVNVPLTASILPVTICQKSNLELKVTTIGGSGGNTYAWTGPNGYSNTVDQNPILPYVEGGPSLAGIYNVTVTDSGGATATATVVVNESTNVPIVLDFAITPTSNCDTDINQYGVLTVSGGLAPYQYKIDEAGIINGQIVTLYNGHLPRFTYKFSVVDAQGCKAINNFEHIRERVSAYAKKNKIYPEDPYCTNSEVKLSGYINNYTSFEWTLPNGNKSSILDLTIPNASMEDGGIYTLTATDAFGCSATSAVEVIVINSTPIAITSGLSTVYQNAPNTTYTTNAPNSAQVSYSLAPWNAGNISPEGVVDWDENFAGEATITATLNILCGGTATKIVNIIPFLTATIGTITPSNCNGPDVGAVEIIPTGGTAPYTITPAQTGLSVGTHIFLVTDADMNTKEVVVEVPLVGIDMRFGINSEPIFRKQICTNSPTEIMVYSNSILLVPGNYSIEYEVQTWTPSYNRTIQTATFVVAETGIGKFNHTINISGISQLLRITKIVIGTCNYPVNHWEMAQISTPRLPNIISCPGPQILQTVEGQNTATFDLNWYIINFLNNQAIYYAQNYSVTGATTASGLGDGRPEYDINQSEYIPKVNFNVGLSQYTITTNDGCNPPETCTFDVLVLGPDTTPPTFTSCPENIVVPTDAGSTTIATVTYPSPIATDNSGTAVTLSVTEGFLSGSPFPLSTQVVTTTATDAAGNTATCSFTVTVYERTLPLVEDTTVPAQGVTEITLPEDTYQVTVPEEGNVVALLILNFPEGAASITVDGITYGPPAMGTTFRGVSNLVNIIPFPPGGISVPTDTKGIPTVPIIITPENPTETTTVVIEYVAVNDQNKTSPVSATITVNFIQPLIASVFKINNVACFGNNTGSVEFNVSGGNAPYNISPSVDNLSAGTYDFTITDAKGVTTSATVNITQPQATLAITQGASVEACNNQPGTVSINVTGGTAPYQLTASTGGNIANGILTGLPGMYTVTATDAEGCTLSIPVTISDCDNGLFSIRCHSVLKVEDTYRPAPGPLYGGLYITLIKSWDRANGQILGVYTIGDDAKAFISRIPYGNYTLVFTTNPTGARTPNAPIGYVFEGEKVIVDPSKTGGTIAADIPDGILYLNNEIPSNGRMLAPTEPIVNIEFIFKPGAPLPLNLLTFTGKPTPMGNELYWKTSSEVNFSHFEVERSSPHAPKVGTVSESFEKIGEVKGNSAENYKFIDSTTPLGPGVLYRLRLVDLDGRYEYSKVISIRRSVESTVNIYPNPASDYIYVENTSTPYFTVQLIDAKGRIISTHLNTNKIAVKNMTNGVYYVQILSNEQNSMRKVVIQK